MQLDPKQEEAVELCLNNKQRVVAVTGAAGTGKTTIIRMVADELRAQGKRVRIAAPTGKAARRITEATGHAATTIHKLLEYPNPGERDPETGKPLSSTEPKRDYKNPIEADAVLVDEYMMVGHALDRNLLDAIGRGTIVRMFGDVNQLPPIDDSNVKNEDKASFEKHIERCSIALEHIFRQGEGSGILVAANSIRKGHVPAKNDEFMIANVENPVKALSKYVLTAREGGVDFATIKYQIISPTRKTWVGTIALNQTIRRALMPNPEFEIELPRHTWEKENRLRVAIGDKVVCTENTYDMRNYEERYTAWQPDGTPRMESFIPTPPTKQMLNGETGIITDIHMDGGLEIDMGDRVVEVPSSFYEYSWKNETIFDLDPRKRLELAYVLTTHKCQGSEYQRIVYVVNKSSSFMLNRRNFYTAVTRAREHVTVATDRIGLHRAVMPAKEWKR